AIACSFGLAPPVSALPWIRAGIAPRPIVMPWRYLETIRGAPAGLGRRWTAGTRGVNLPRGPRHQAPWGTGGHGDDEGHGWGAGGDSPGGALRPLQHARGLVRPGGLGQPARPIRAGHHQRRAGGLRQQGPDTSLARRPLGHSGGPWARGP